MIFVTTGTALSHPSLIRKIDNLVKDGKLKNVIMQVGNSEYIPKYCGKWYRFLPNLNLIYDREDLELVISNCGSGTIFENIVEGRSLIVVSNPDIEGGYEEELPRKMESGGHLLWCKDVENILYYIDKSKRFDFKKFSSKDFDFDLLNNKLKSWSK